MTLSDKNREIINQFIDGNGFDATFDEGDISELGFDEYDYKLAELVDRYQDAKRALIDYIERE